MVSSIRVMTAQYENIRLKETDAGKLRGFFADLDTGDSILHNHTEAGGDIYRYPRIQYKILEGTPVIVAAEEGINSIYPHLLQVTELKIDNMCYSDTKLRLMLSDQIVGPCGEMRKYWFATPWLALNQGNRAKYREADVEERQALLSRILIGNLLSLCKAFGVTVEAPLRVEHNFRSRTVIYKGNRMEGFTGWFRVNCAVPELLGIGKGVASGFGAVREDDG